MRLLIYSDLHLEFGSKVCVPVPSQGDVLVLAGDIITFRDYQPIAEFLGQWNERILFVAGNHEYYTELPKNEEDERFLVWVSSNLPNMDFLRDEAVTIDGVNFFGGTMWTDFDGGSEASMAVIRYQMNDFERIMNSDGSIFQPEDAAALHQVFKNNLISWFEEDLTGPRVVISHHAPVINPRTKYRNSPLMPGFNSLDMLEVIQKYQPDLWIYGHTHECDDHTIGRTRIVSNQLGYPDPKGGYECGEFDWRGKQILI